MTPSVSVNKIQVSLNRTRSNNWKRIRKNWVLYLFLLPCITYIIVLNYVPMYGIQIAFKDFRASLGILGSPWVGLKHFSHFFGSYQFEALLYNTLSLSVYQLAATIPLPVFLALLLNYTTFSKLKKTAQTATYAPHLISVVVMAGMLTVFCSQTGLFNQLLGLFGISPIQFLGQEKMYKSIYVWSTVWQRTGFNAVIYIAALAGVSSELHEAAVVDGANKIKRVIHIDIPAIMPTMIILVIMNLGNIMGIGFEKAFLLQNSLNLGSSEIISTYVYKVGIVGAQYSYATAIGLFNNTINFILLLSVNYAAKKLSSSSLW